MRGERTPSPAFGHPCPFPKGKGPVSEGYLTSHDGAKPQDTTPLALPPVAGEGVPPL